MINIEPDNSPLVYLVSRTVSTLRSNIEKNGASAIKSGANRSPCNTERRLYVVPETDIALIPLFDVKLRQYS